MGERIIEISKGEFCCLGGNHHGDAGAIQPLSLGVGNGGEYKGTEAD